MMTFDSEEHREMIKELVGRASFPGPLARQVVSLMDAIEAAAVAEPSPGKSKPSPKRAA